MQLKKALLCLDCDEIFYEYKECPSCGSPTFKHLISWIKPLYKKGEK